MVASNDLEKLARKETFRLEIEAEFLAAMNKGYAAMDKPKKGAIVELPGSKLVPPYTRGPWKVVDFYLVSTLSQYSGGMTIISYQGVPVWMMQYFGEYEEAAIPCLKAALRTAYAEKVFLNGRGPRSFWHDGYRYRNMPTIVPRNRFPQGSFEGTEEIEDAEGKRCGWHNYQGGLMV